MSKSLESQVWQSALDPELKPLAAVMADMGNDDGLGIYPSVEYLGWLLGRSERAIQRGLKSLCRLGILDRVANASGGRGLTPRYRLFAEKLPARPSWKETRKGDSVTPFQAQKGDTNDQKGDILSQKGDTVTPDPLVEPLVRSNIPPAGYRVPKKPPEEKTLYPPERFSITDWMYVYLAERCIALSEDDLRELTDDWRRARNADSQRPKTLWNWQHDWLRYVCTAWRKRTRNGNGHGEVVNDQPMKTLKERMGIQ